jgi:hypothetical protein
MVATKLTAHSAVRARPAMATLRMFNAVATDMRRRQWITVDG